MLLPLSIQACQSLGIDYASYSHLYSINRMLSDVQVYKYDTIYASLHSKLNIYANSLKQVERQLNAKVDYVPWIKDFISTANVDAMIKNATCLLKYCSTRLYLKKGWSLSESIESRFKKYHWNDYDWDDNARIFSPKSVGYMPKMGIAMTMIMRFFMASKTALLACMMTDFSIEYLMKLPRADQKNFLEDATVVLSRMKSYIMFLMHFTWLFYHDCYQWLSRYFDYIERSEQYLSALQVEDVVDAYALVSDKPLVTNKSDKKLQDFQSTLCELLKENVSSIRELSKLWLLQLKIKHTLWSHHGTDLEPEHLGQAARIFLSTDDLIQYQDWVGKECVVNMHEWVSSHIEKQHFHDDLAIKINSYRALLASLSMKQLIDEWDLLAGSSHEMVPRQIDIVSGILNDPVGRLQDKYGWVSVCVLPYCGRAYQNDEKYEAKNVLECGLWSVKKPAGNDLKFQQRVVALEAVYVDHSLAKLCGNDAMLRVCDDLSKRAIVF